ncbi:MAG TPA: TIM barrel protein [Nitrososphaeraceae archaeon]|nr:TIM barrel protein [Nitrososphaeraceae archaeon]
MVTGNTQFIELQVHDKLKDRWNDLKDDIKVAESFKGFLTIHGEGENDGRKRILFSAESGIRRQYVKSCAQIYSAVLHHLNENEVKRVIVHPDTIDRKRNRLEQIAALSESLVNLYDDLLHDNVEICIEPRGCDRHKKVLRAEIADLEILDEFLHKFGCEKIGLCIDIAQLFICKGNEGTIFFLSKLNKNIREFHISDAVNGRIGVEIGIGLIDWSNIIPLMINFCEHFLIETIGGLKVFDRSLRYLDKIGFNA